MAKEKKDKTNKILVVEETVEVKKSAVSISNVAGTPQDARIAILNTSNQAIFLSSGGNSLISGSGLFIKSKAVEEGDSYKVSQKLSDSNSDLEVELQTVWIQKDKSANSMLNLIVKAYDMKYKEISIEIFGNPLIQVGDFAKITYQTDNINFKDDEYWIITKINHSFSEGLKTTLVAKPLGDIISS